MIVTLSGRYLGDRVSIKTRDKFFCFPGYGFSIPYDGRHQNFYSWSIYSYKGNKIQLGDYQKNERMGDQGRISATYDKSALLKSLLRGRRSSKAAFAPGSRQLCGPHNVQIVTD